MVVLFTVACILYNCIYISDENYHLNIIQIFLRAVTAGSFPRRKLEAYFKIQAQPWCQPKTLKFTIHYLGFYYTQNAKMHNVQKYLLHGETWLISQLP